MAQPPIDYHAYMASRDWRLKRKNVIERNDGLCYRCLSAPIADVHHVSYARLGHEDDNDLIGVCRPCHEYLSAERDEDPALAIILPLLGKGLVDPAIHEDHIHFWTTNPLPNGMTWTVEFRSDPDIKDDIPWTVVFDSGHRVYMHFYWL